MNTKEKTAYEKRRPIRALFHMEELNDRNMLVTFFLLQVYFLCNLLSFGYWKESVEIFLILILYFGIWIIGLTLVLAFLLKFKYRKILIRYSIAVLAILSLPLFGIWIQSLEIRENWLEWVLLLLFPFAIAIYYRLGQNHVVRISVVMLGLCFLSFLGHAGFFLNEQIDSGNDHLNLMLSEISLDRKPNIHVIFFDALTDSTISQEFLGVSNPAADYLAQLDDTIYAERMGYSENVPTWHAWSTLFGLGTKVSTSRGHPFTGRSQSPLASLLRNNGYKIQTGFSSNFFGNERGPYVDYYYVEFHIEVLNRTLICSQKLLGFCSKFTNLMYEKFFANINVNPSSSYEAYSENVWPNRVIELIDQSESQTNNRAFSAFHIYMPGHAPKDYEIGDAIELEKYSNHFASETRKVREALIDLNDLRLRFPDSIFIVSGDHGAMLTNNAAKEDDERFWILDRHAIALALLNAHNLCPESAIWLKHQIYLTPSRMLAASLACDGESRNLLKHFQDNPEFVKFRKIPSNSE